MSSKVRYQESIRILPAELFSITVVERKDNNVKVILSCLIKDKDKQYAVSGWVTDEELIEYTRRIGGCINVEEVTLYRLTPNPLFIPTPTAQINPNSKQSE